MKRLLSGFLVCAIIVTTVQFLPLSFATENSAHVETNDIISEAIEYNLYQEEIYRQMYQNDRFIVHSSVPIAVGDTLGERHCVACRPLQSNCKELNGFYVITLDELVLPKEFIPTLANQEIEIYPDSRLDFASVESEAEEITPAIFNLEENLSAAQAVATGEGIIVALLDNGVDINHVELRSHLVEGWDFFHGGGLMHPQQGPLLVRPTAPMLPGSLRL